MTGSLFSNILDGRMELPSGSPGVAILSPDLEFAIEARRAARRKEEAEAARQYVARRFEEEILEEFPTILEGVKADELDELAQKRELATLKVYLRRFKRFALWSAERGVVEMPYPPSVVATYLLVEVAHGMSKTEAKLVRTAIQAIHELAEFAPPCRTSIVKRTIEFIMSLPDGDGGKPAPSPEQKAAA